MKVLGLITARAGSKRIPGKNIKEFLGKPLLFWTIKAAQDANVLDRVILSTDSQEIAKIGKGFGAEIPFLRPIELAQDKSSSFDVVLHAFNWLKQNQSYEPDWILLLEPTAPGRRYFHIKQAVDLMKNQAKADSIVGVSKLPGHFSPLKALKKDEQGLLSRFFDNELIRNLTHRNQDLPEVYFINSTIYGIKKDNLLSENPSMWGNKVLSYLMDSKYALDIDTLDDWVIAEAKMKKILEEEN